MAASGFTENVDVESVKHQQLRTLVKTQTDGHMDHTTFLELGHMAVLLTEPYHSKTVHMVHLLVLQLDLEFLVE